LEVTIVAPPTPPLPPARAEAVEPIMLTVVDPPTKVDIRIRTLVYPATFACQVPVLVADVTAVVLLLGVTLSATQEVPPSPLDSNWIVFADRLAVMVKVAPPWLGSIETERQAVAEQVAPAVVKFTFCWPFTVAARSRNAGIRMNRRILPSGHGTNAVPNNPSATKLSKFKVPVPTALCVWPISTSKASVFGTVQVLVPRSVP
jgi:hypothetical protein